MGAAFSNRGFLWVGGTLFFWQLSANVFNHFSLFPQIHVLNRGNTKAGAILAEWIAVVHFATFMVSVGIGSRFAQRFSKRAVLIIGAVITILAGLSKLFLYNPEMLWLEVLSPLISAPAGAIGAFVVAAMMADLAIYDQWKTGERREAIYTATASWLYKAALSMSRVWGGALLVGIGFDQSLNGKQSEFTKTWLSWGSFSEVFCWESLASLR